VPHKNQPLGLLQAGADICLMITSPAMIKWFSPFRNKYSSKVSRH